MYLKRDYFSGSIALSTTTEFTKDIDFTPIATSVGVFVSGVFENADTGITSVKVYRVLGDAPSAWTDDQKVSLLGQASALPGQLATSMYIPTAPVKIDSADTYRIVITIQNTNASSARTYNVAYEAYGS